MPAAKEPTVAELVAAGNVDEILRLVENASAGVGDPELVAQIQALEAELAVERERAAKMNPMADWPIVTNAAELIAHLGEEHLLEIALQEVAGENRENMKKYLVPLYTSLADHRKLAKERIPRIAATMAAEAGKWVPTGIDEMAQAQPRKMRTFKMIAPRRRCEQHDEGPVSVCFEHGSMRQIPVELQINNGAASLNDPIERYARKGFKPATPVRCKLVDCYRPAAITDGGEWAHGMYCSQNHHQYMEGSKATTKAGNEVDLYSMVQR